MIIRNNGRVLSNWVRAGLVAVGLLATAVPASTAFAQVLDGDFVRSGAPAPGKVVRSSPHFFTSLMQSFRLRFWSGDRPIREITVRPDLPRFGETTLVFMDDNGDDSYQYHSRQTVLDIGDDNGDFVELTCDGVCTVDARRPPGDYVFVLQGFSFAWTSGVRNLQHIGVYEQNGILTVAFTDQRIDRNDTFHAAVQYAYVPRSRFGSLGTVVRWNVGDAVDAQPLPAAGTVVIRGFDIAFTETDHWINEFGFVTDSSSVTAYFNDINQEERFNWALDWGILN